MPPPSTTMTLAEPMPASEARSELLVSIARWREELTHIDLTRSTLGFGIAARSVTLVGLLLRLTVRDLLPEAALGDRPTLGQRISALERYGPRHRTTCSEPDRKLVGKTDLELLRKLSRMRSFVAHQEDHTVAADVGRLAPGAVTEFLDVVEAVARLPVFEELVCAERAALG